MNIGVPRLLSFVLQVKSGQAVIASLQEKDEEEHEEESAFTILSRCHKNSENMKQHQRYRWQNLPSVLLIPVVHLHLRISPRILKKFEMLFSGAWGKMIHEKKPESKNLVTLSL